MPGFELFGLDLVSPHSMEASCLASMCLEALGHCSKQYLKEKYFSTVKTDQYRHKPMSSSFKITVRTPKIIISFSSLSGEDRT